MYGLADATVSWETLEMWRSLKWYHVANKTWQKDHGVHEHHRGQAGREGRKERDVVEAVNNSSLPSACMIGTQKKAPCDDLQSLN